MKTFLALSLSDVTLIMLLNVKMSTIIGILVGILTFMGRINFVSSFKSLRCYINHAFVGILVGILTFMSRINFVLS